MRYLLFQKVVKWCALSKYPDFILKGNLINVYPINVTGTEFMISAGMVENAGVVLEMHASKKAIKTCFARCVKRVPKKRFCISDDYENFSVFKFVLYKRPTMRFSKKKYKGRKGTETKDIQSSREVVDQVRVDVAGLQVMDMVCKLGDEIEWIVKKKKQSLEYQKVGKIDENEKGYRIKGRIENICVVYRRDQSRCIIKNSDRQVMRVEAITGWPYYKGKNAENFKCFGIGIAASSIDEIADELAKVDGIRI